ncbi:MAG TPA: EAL domain-containing protein [Thermoanaerobaculia bacterium]|nr:EAL domain-containing protein [Thermoanaerobaculia bacterium]
MTNRVAQAALERALENDDLLLHYQPIHDTVSSRIVAAEALLRQMRESGEVREAKVIAEAAENSPALFALSSRTMLTAFDDASQWYETHGLRLHVNVSAREFVERDIVSTATAALSSSKLAPQAVVFEITETTYIERPKDVIGDMEKLRGAGFALWLDDFGTGHSSLLHLRHFPLDGLKIAAEFIARLESDRRCRAISRSLIEVAHELDLKVVAEGVERESQREILAEWDCDFIQGFLFNRPMSTERFQQLLTSGGAA